MLPLAQLDRIMKNAGAQRVGEDAKKKMAEILEEYALDIAKKAIALANHAKRKTIKAEDINLAIKS